MTFYYLQYFARAYLKEQDKRKGNQGLSMTLIANLSACDNVGCLRFNLTRPTLCIPFQLERLVAVHSLGQKLAHVTGGFRGSRSLSESAGAGTPSRSVCAGRQTQCVIRATLGFTFARAPSQFHCASFIFRLPRPL